MLTLLSLLYPALVPMAQPAMSSPSVVRFVEAQTGTRVWLVGTMHHNPASCSAASSAVQAAAANDGLFSVLVELCDARWNGAKELEFCEWMATDPDLPLSTRLDVWIKDDEFRAAFDAAFASGVESFELMDQPIDETLARLRHLLGQTVRDLAAGPAGWGSIFADLRLALTQISRGLVFDRALLIGVPAALLRGPMASPALGGLLALLVFVTNRLVVEIQSGALEAAAASGEGLLEGVEVAATLAVAVILARVGLVALLTERNAVMARNIRLACARAAGAADGPAAAAMSDGQALPTGGGLPPRASVLAVVGMMHIGGVRELLESESGVSN